MNILYLITSLLPILAPFILLVVLRMSAKKGMTISMILMVILSLVIWQVNVDVVGASFLVGLHKALTILLILFGAMALVETLKNTKAIQRINQGFMSITSDKRVLAILVAFLFGALIEGASGFGTPAAITGPLLVSMGFSPVIAAVVALVADSVPVSFGAVGTPIAVGLNAIPIDGNIIAEQVTFIDLFSGVFIPFILVAIYVIISNTYTNKRKAILEMVPFSLFIGVLYTIIAYLVSLLFGFEFVSIITPILMIGIVTLSSRYQFLLPKTEQTKHEKQSTMSLLKAWSPYVVVVVLLIITRVVLPIKDLIVGLDFLSLTNVFNTGLSSNFSIFYSPGTILILASLFASYYQKGNITPFVEASKSTVKILYNAALALVPTLILVTIFSSSGANAASLSSMPSYIATTLSSVFESNWPLVSPFLGILGSFVTGSATVSNLTFAEVQYQVANGVGISATIIIAQHVVGAAVGNMICVHNVVAASAVVGLSNQEGAIIKKTVIPALIYGGLVAIIGFLLITF